MSPLVKRKKERYSLPTKYILLILTLICVILMILSFTTNILSAPLNFIGGYSIVPFQKGLTSASSYFVNRTANLKKMEELTEENEKLRAQVDELLSDNTNLQQDKYELAQLRELFDLNSEYEEYDKVGAHIIASDPGNWYSSFVIDKGAKDGIQVDCNVIAGSGLVGRVTSVGPNYSKVISIISDNVNTSAMMLASEDNLIVTGNLETMKNGVIEYSQLADSDEKVGVGDKVVTSNISDKYLPGILIGYIDTINTDSNNLTKSGTLIPVVDFKHLEEVLVIKQVKLSPYSE
ncbi:MAG: rod shape-determining protein MreC [Lachnospiraceae bacterium]|nr:rod shape-determining protein MreC [Candidatus Colinaster equi]